MGNQLLTFTPVKRPRQLSTLKTDNKAFEKLQKLFSLEISKKIFNSLKFVDIKFRKENNTPKMPEESLSYDPKPLLFVMPPIIRKEFDNFNKLDSQNDENFDKIKENTQNQPLLHQFLPDINFMKQAMVFRELDFQKNQIIKKEPEKRGILYVFKNLFQKKEKNEKKIITERKVPNFGRKIALLGFHGWFPNRFIQKVIGDPRRTSTRMVDMLEEAVNEADPYPPFCEGPASIYRFPLQGEGTIEERVEKHLEELRNISPNYSHEGISSLEHLKESDTVLLGAHSQGAPVAIILLAKLLEEGIINPSRQNVTVLTVAGIFHGPFPPLRKNLVVQYVEADAARQLFDLNNPDSKVSSLFKESLDKVLQSGINITCVASWLDQVVPFYSACLLGFEHPNIWRSIHINADHYSQDFLTKLVEVGLKIKNTGPFFGEPETHMILAELSDYISGSIYQHATHSSAYRKIDSFRTALEWMKIGPKSINIPIKDVAHVRHKPLQSTVNPYYLPWLFRGWLKSPELLNNPLIGAEILELQNLYSNWNPESKLLKDFKFKLEPISLLSKM